jgi:hypothetical protein
MKSYAFDLLGNKAHLQTNSIIFLYTMWNEYAKGRSGKDVLAKDVQQTLFQKYGDSIKVWGKRGHFLANCGYLKEPGAPMDANYIFTNKFLKLFKLYYKNLENIVLEYNERHKRALSV